MYKLIVCLPKGAGGSQTEIRCFYFIFITGYLFDPPTFLKYVRDQTSNPRYEWVIWKLIHLLPQTCSQTVTSSHYWCITVVSMFPQDFSLMKSMRRFTLMTPCGVSSSFPFLVAVGTLPVFLPPPTTAPPPPHPHLLFLFWKVETNYSKCESKYSTDSPEFWCQDQFILLEITKDFKELSCVRAIYW